MFNDDVDIDEPMCTELFYSRMTQAIASRGQGFLISDEDILPDLTQHYFEQDKVAVTILAEGVNTYYDLEDEDGVVCLVGFALDSRNTNVKQICASFTPDHDEWVKISGDLAESPLLHSMHQYYLNRHFRNELLDNVRVKAIQAASDRILIELVVPLAADVEGASEEFDLIPVAIQEVIRKIELAPTLSPHEWKNAVKDAKTFKRNAQQFFYDIILDRTGIHVTSGERKKAIGNACGLLVREINIQELYSTLPDESLEDRLVLAADFIAMCFADLALAENIDERPSKRILPRSEDTRVLIEHLVSVVRKSQ